MSDEAQNEGPIIPEEDFCEAIAACRQDPELDRYFRLAPKGARLFIGLGFYSTHFGEKTDKTQYQACLAEIEPSLTPKDLKYLIRFERDAKTKEYLRDLLKRREAEAQAVAAHELPPVSKAATQQIKPIFLKPPVSAANSESPQPSNVPPSVPASSAPAPAPERKSRRTASSGLRLIVDDEPTAEHHLGLPIAVGVAVVAVMGCLYGLNSASQAKAALGRQQESVTRLSQQVRELQAELAKARAERPKEAVVAASVKTEEEATPEVEPEKVESSETAEEESVEAEVAQTVSNAVETAASAVKPGVRVVLTDGPKIVRRADGKLIEVPRVFSYSGAGLKKPFWLYDKKLSEAKMEIEAQKEKQARDAWRVLHDEAERQENAASRKSNGQVERVDKRTCDLVEYAAKTIAI